MPTLYIPVNRFYTGETIPVPGSNVIRIGTAFGDGDGSIFKNIALTDFFYAVDVYILTGTLTAIQADGYSPPFGWFGDNEGPCLVYNTTVPNEWVWGSYEGYSPDTSIVFNAVDEWFTIEGHGVKSGTTWTYTFRMNGSELFTEDDGGSGNNDGYFAVGTTNGDTGEVYYYDNIKLGTGDWLVSGSGTITDSVTFDDGTYGDFTPNNTSSVNIIPDPTGR